MARAYKNAERRANMYDLQKASMWKRLSAGLFDAIILGVVAVAAALLVSLITGYSGYMERLEARYQAFEDKYGIDIDISDAEYEALSQEEKDVYAKADEEFSKDEEANELYYMLFSLTLVITIFGILLAYMLLEFLIPLLFGNGQTLGKRIFGIGVMRIDGVKVNPMLMLIRTLLGKYTIETMIPVLLVVMLLFGIVGVLGTAIIILVFVSNIAMMGATKTNSAIHDMLANTVTVDLASQMIFDTEEAMLEYKQRVHEAHVESSKY